MNQYLRNLRKIEFVVTMACTGKCRHCSEGDHEGCTEHIEGRVASDAVRKICAHYDISTVMTFGGEPLLYPETVCVIHKTAAELGAAKRQVITNGFFSKNRDRIKAVAHNLAESGVNDLLLSVDAFHQETIPLETVMFFAECAVECGVPIRLQPAWLVSPEDQNPYNVKTNEIIIASDVTNTLCGKNGATFVFGFQKGATEETAKILEENMLHYAEIIKRDAGIDVLGLQGGGAAGGVGTALMAFFGGKMRSGAELLLQTAEFQRRVLDADFVITGEGKLDSQSLGGKLPAKVADICRGSGSSARIIAVAGVVELDEETLKKGGFDKAFMTSNGERDFEKIKLTCRDDLKNAFIKATEYMKNTVNG